MEHPKRNKKERQVNNVSHNKRKTWIENADWLPIMPLAFILLVVPLIVYGRFVTAEESSRMLMANSVSQVELNNYYKGIWFLMATLVSMLVFLGRRLKGELPLRKTPLFYPLAVFLVMAVISTVMSEYRAVALSGYPGRYEGLYILLGYGMVFFTTVQLVKKQKQFQLLLTVLWASTVLMSLLGLLQSAGLNPFLTEFGQRVILPSKLHQYIGQFEGTGGGRDVFLTMGNSNYAGGYMSMMLVVFLAVMFMTENRRTRIILLITNAMMMISLLMSGSRAGYVAVIATAIPMALILRKQIKVRWTYVAIVIVLLVVSNLSLSALASRSFYSELRSVFEDITTVSEPYPNDIKDLALSDDSISLVGENTTLVVQLDQSGSPSYFNEKNEMLEWSVEPGAENEEENHSITTDGYEQYRVSWKPHEVGEKITINNGFVDADFFYYDKKLYLIGKQGELVSYKPVESFGFKGRESMGSNRGYVWSRSLPLLSDTLLIGNGPDTFVYYFPQFDYLATLQQKVRANSLYDKPHNLYLQTAINTGVISLIALLAFFGMYLSRSFRKYYREGPVTWQNQTGIAIMSGCVAYLTAGFFNDSVIGVSVVFWVLLGLGTSLILQQES